MPIYEFYCADCHTVFSFLSRSVNTTASPACPRCRRKKLTREVSAFAMTGKHTEGEGMDDLPIDERKMEDAVTRLAAKAEGIDENDPRQAARLMRDFSGMTGLALGETMESALSRMESGEDPEKVEAELGAAMDGEDPFVLPGAKGQTRGGSGRVRGAPRRDATLYEL